MFKHENQGWLTSFVCILQKMGDCRSTDRERQRQLVEEATRPIVQVTSHPVQDAAMERAKATFCSDNLSVYLNGGVECLERRKQLIDILSKQPWGDKKNRYFLSREEEHVAGLRGAVGIWKMMKEHNLSIQDAAEMRQLLFLPGGFELHIGMFIPTILSQGTREQQDRWMPLCMDLRLIGTYAQTELGHGTFLRGLETVAVYDPETRSFIIHSPTLTATKWWPGGLGKTCTHAILMARLITKGKDYGPHAFVVQLRDLETHKALPGVEVGDIGPKMGYHGVDNGFLRFDHVKVPRDAMLMRYSSITEDGTYVPPPPRNSKASYGTMVYVRATIVRDAGDFLGRAATIAVRYTAIRRQSSPDASRRELQILDYENVYETLMPIVAASFALRFMGKNIMSMYNAFVKAKENDDFSTLPELHALSSGLKAFCTDAASFGIEECRRTCGGQGYSVLSGLPTIYTSYVQNVTWEGDNNVMYLQMARYLMKMKAGVTKEKTMSMYSKQHVIRPSQARVPADWTQTDNVAQALKNACAHAAQICISRISPHAQAQPVFEGDLWNSSTMDLINLAKSHCRLVTYMAFLEEISHACSDRAVQPESIHVLRELCSLFGLVCLQESGAALLECGHITGDQHAMIRHQFKVVCRSLRKNAIALVDSFGYDDYLLNSAIGRKDGNVYETLLETAKRSPFNATEQGPGWNPVLKDLLNPQARSKL